jgi:hypothetical protein
MPPAAEITLFTVVTTFELLNTPFESPERRRGPAVAGPLQCFVFRLAYCFLSSTEAPVAPPSDVEKLYVMFAGTGALAPTIDFVWYLIPMM